MHFRLLVLLLSVTVLFVCCADKSLFGAMGDAGDSPSDSDDDGDDDDNGVDEDGDSDDNDDNDDDDGEDEDEDDSDDEDDGDDDSDDDDDEGDKTEDEEEEETKEEETEEEETGDDDTEDEDTEDDDTGGDDTGGAEVYDCEHSCASNENDCYLFGGHPVSGSCGNPVHVCCQIGGQVDTGNDDTGNDDTGNDDTGDDDTGNDDTGNDDTEDDDTEDDDTEDEDTEDEDTGNDDTGGNSNWGNEQPPARLNNGQTGYASRYWDCCMSHCSWPENFNPPLKTCDINNNPIGSEQGSACSGGGGHTCWDLAPWAAGENIAYGFAAVPAEGDICGRCYQLDFTGDGHYGPMPGGSQITSKTMIVQAINIGGDVAAGQFDVLIPGGGVGAFNACSNQWGQSDLGAQYGGFYTACEDSLGYEASLQQYKDCVAGHCQRVFGDKSDLMAGCDWFIDWLHVANNPVVRYSEVSCPSALTNKSGMYR